MTPLDLSDPAVLAGALAKAGRVQDMEQVRRKRRTEALGYWVQPIPTHPEGGRVAYSREAKQLEQHPPPQPEEIKAL